MKITVVRVRKIAKEGKMRAVVSITIDDEFVVHDIKVIDTTALILPSLEIFLTLTSVIFITHPFLNLCGSCYTLV